MERVFTLEKETEQGLREQYRDATKVSVIEDGETCVRMWVKNGKRTACWFIHNGKNWTILFNRESRVYQDSSYAFDVEFSGNGHGLKEELDEIADKAWDEYKSLIG